jgi:hypothetical protein
MYILQGLSKNDILTKDDSLYNIFFIYYNLNFGKILTNKFTN